MATLGTFSGELAAQSTVRTWTIVAKVVDVSDLDNIFADVRLEDPVRGFISYDLATPAEHFDPNTAFYTHAPPFQVAGMVVKNPRDGSNIEFVAEKTDVFVLVTNDFDDGFGQFDGLGAVQVVLPPAGFSGDFPTVVVDFESPESLPDTSLPERLDLQDWPLASIGFYDAFDLDGSFIEAEIFALTPIETSVVPGDVNLDGLVNGLDVDPFVDVLLSGTYQAEADMNEDQVVNGLDVDPFVAAVVGGGAQSIPEPSTLLLAILALSVVGRWRKWGV